MRKVEFDYDDLDESYFLGIANVLLNKYYLRVNKSKYRLIEIEFYLKCNGHSDPYTHCDPDQLLMRSFYFHKFKTGTYKAGTFKGLDLTFGDANTDSYFGILIRSVQKISKNSDNIIEGPCNTVNAFLKEYDCSSIMEFTKGKNLNIFSNKHNFVLVKDKTLEERQIWMGPRIGLSNKYPDYQNSNYRFVSDKSKIKKRKTSLVEV